MLSTAAKHRIKSAVLGVLGLAVGTAAVYDLVYDDFSLRAEINTKYANAPAAVLPISEEISAPVNINTATARELRGLSGIGEVKARAIVEYRELHGDFASVDELVKVSGIGEKTLENIRGEITV